MKSQAAINWTMFLGILATLVLSAAFGMDAEPLPEPEALNDAQVAAQTADQERQCSELYGAGYIFLARKEYNICRDGGLK